MATQSTGKFLPTLKLRLGTKAVICAILLIAVNTALVVGAAHWSLTSEFGDRALRDIEINLRTLSLAFAGITSSLVLPFSAVCPLLSYFRLVLIALGLFIAYRIIGGR